MKRKLTITLTCLLALLAIAVGAAHLFLHSSYVTSQVTTRLEAMYGGPVRFDRVDIGLFSSTIRGLELFEQGDSAEPPGFPWLRVASATAHVSLGALVLGEMPSRVELEGADAEIRFNRMGDLATRFPHGSANSNQAIPWAKIPDIMMHNSSVTVHKIAYGKITVNDASASIIKKSGRLVLSGSGRNAELGKLNLDGSVAEESEVATVHVRSEAMGHVTEAFVDRLPFVPPEVGQEFQIVEGDTIGDVSVSYNLTTKSLHYRVDVSAENTRLAIPRLDVAAQSGSGRLIVQDNVVQLRDVKGEAFGGSISTDADVDFRGAISKVTFSTRFDNLDVSQVPKQWQVPAVVRRSVENGRLFGTANLETTIGASHVSSVSAALLVARLAPEFTAGQWLSRASMIAAFPTDEPQVKSRGKGELRDPSGQYEPIQFDWQLAQKPFESPGGSGHTGNGHRTFSFAELLTLACLPSQDQKDVPKASEYLDFNFHLKNASLAEVMKNEGIVLPFPVTGKGSIEIKASIPAGQLGDLKAYKARGSAHLTDLALAGLKLDELSADFTYADGAVDIKLRKTAIGPDNAAKAPTSGSIFGGGRVQLAPLGPVQADLTLERIPVHKLAELPEEKLQGTLSAKFSLRGSTDKLQGAKELHADGKIRTDGLTIYGIRVEEFATSLHLKDGVVTFPDLHATVEGARLAAPISVRMNADDTVVANIDVRDWSLAALQKLLLKQSSFPALDGGLSANVVVEGRLNSKEGAIAGNFRTDDFKFGALEAKDVHFGWRFAKNELGIEGLSISLYDGKVTGNAVIPFKSDTPGHVEVTVKEIDVNGVAKVLHAPVRIEGKVNGKFAGEMPAAPQGQARAATFQVDVKAPKIHVQNIETDQLSGTIKYGDGKAAYKLTGNTLGGTFELEGRLPGGAPPQETKQEEKGLDGRLRINNVHIARFLAGLGVPKGRDLRGVFNLDLAYKHGAADWFPDGAGKMRIANLGWGDTVLADNLRGEVLLSEQGIRLRNFGGGIAQGILAVQAAYFPKEPGRSWFTIDLDRVESGALLGPWLGKKIQGTLQTRIRGNLGSTWRGSADFALGNSKILGFEIVEWRVPVAWSFAPAQNRGRIEVRECSGQLSSGRASTKMTLAMEDSARVEGFLRLDNVDLKDVLRQTIGTSDVIGGRGSARVDFNGTNVRSVNDIGAKITASFTQSQALQVPVLQQITPFLGLGASTTFQRGNLRARLDGGTLRIEQLALQGNVVRVFVDGSVTLSERLNLHVVAKTTDFGWPTLQLGPIALRLPLAGPVPLVALEEATALLSNHVINLDVTGTAQNPVIRPRTLALLSQEAFRFFLLQSNLPISLNP